MLETMAKTINATPSSLFQPLKAKIATKPAMNVHSMIVPTADTNSPLKFCQ
jgi:hypothetical protein